MLAAANGRLTAFFPAENEFASPMRFRIAAQDQIRIYTEIDERGEEVAIFHSHPNTEAAPSQTDINLAANWPDPVYLIVGDDEAETFYAGPAALVLHGSWSWLQNRVDRFVITNMRVFRVHGVLARERP